MNMFMFKPREVKIEVRDGVHIAVALYMPREHPSALVLPVTEGFQLDANKEA